MAWELQLKATRLEDRTQNRTAVQVGNRIGLRKRRVGCGANIILAGESQNGGAFLQLAFDILIQRLQPRLEKSEYDKISSVLKAKRRQAEKAWILRFLSACERLGRRELLQHVPDAKVSEDKKKNRWEHGVKMLLNRMVNKLGPFDPRLYDAAASKLDDKLRCL